MKAKKGGLVNPETNLEVFFVSFFFVFFLLKLFLESVRCFHRPLRAYDSQVWKKGEW